ncbi:hypothetical protein C8R43DRAFT_1020681 [Mycena crocata]|nr:hypothetical protein C8R43DRAFT_1020681 [Mycena crocata]
MAPYPPNSFVHRLTDYACAFPECSNSKLKGASMRLCSQCKTIHYCNRECQRAHWPLHKDSCRNHAARLAAEERVHGQLGADFEAWRVAMTPLLFKWICIYGLDLYYQREAIDSKFVVLSMSERQQRPSTPLKFFECENIEVVDRDEFIANDLRGDPQAAQTILNSWRHHDEKAKSTGKSGAAVLIIRIRPANDEKRTDLLRTMPVAIGPEEVAMGQERLIDWKAEMAKIIDDGKSIKHAIAKKERKGEL